MAFQLYLQPYPRALYLVSSATALVFKQPESTPKTATLTTDDKAEIELLALDDVDLTRLIKVNKGRNVLGVLGLLSIPVGGTSEIFLLVSTGAISLPPLLPSTALTASKLLSVEFHCLTSSIWDDPSIVPLSLRNDTDSTGLDELEFDQFGSYPQQQQQQQSTRARSQIYSSSSASPSSSAGLGHPCDGMKRYLETGTFYFATTGNWNISKSLSSWDWNALKRGDNVTSVLDDYDDSFGMSHTQKGPCDQLIPKPQYGTQTSYAHYSTSAPTSLPLGATSSTQNACSSPSSKDSPVSSLSESPEQQAMARRYTLD
jgi:hypothetical protein